MSTYQQAIGAGETLRLRVPGDFLRLMAAPADVTITMYRNGSEISKAEGVKAGYAERNAAGFDEVHVYSASAQTIKLIIRNGGDVRYDRFEGDVTIIGAQAAYANSRATVTSSGVSTLVAASASRRYVLIQNNDAAVYLRITMDGVNPTTAQGIRVPPGGAWESPAGCAPTGAVKGIMESGAGSPVEVVAG